MGSGDADPIYWVEEEHKEKLRKTNRTVLKAAAFAAASLAILNAILDNDCEEAPKKTQQHHQTPSEVLKKHLPPDVANDPRVRGKRGMPNRRTIEVDEHKRIHRGKGGGPANELTKQKIEELGREPTVDDVLRIRDEVNKELGIKYID